MKTKSINLFRVLMLTLVLTQVIGCAKKDNTKENDNGTPTCPQGYTGQNCSEQITPSKVFITKIIFTRFSATNSQGESWDPESYTYPDIYPTIVSSSNNVLWTGVSGKVTDASPSLSYDFTPSSPVELNPSQNYYIDLCDDDGAGYYDWMGGFTLTTYSSTGGFPSEKNLDSGGSLAFKVYLTYTW